MPSFVRDVEEIRQRAEHKLEEGAVTQSYKGDVEKTISILNEALATEIVCVLRYMHHYFMATGLHGRSVADEFKEHADSEREHADAIAERIQQLGRKPDFNPRSLLERSVSQYVEGETLAQMIREDLIAERIVIEVYQEMIRYFGSDDPTTRVMLEGILKDEEEHANDLADIMYIADPETGKTEGKDPGTDPLRIGSERNRSQSDGRNGSRREQNQSRDEFLQRRNSGAQKQSRETRKEKEQEPLTPDFYAASQQAWRPGEKSIRTSQLAAKRHESQKAGPPGAPEFSASRKSQQQARGNRVQDQGQLRGNRKSKKPGRAA
jgi:bacterioferritin